MKKLVLAATAVALLSTPVYSQGNNPSEARAMADFLSNGGGTLGGAINPNKTNNGKGTASDVSGGGNGGWGNIGSTLTGVPGESVSGR